MGWGVTTNPWNKPKAPVKPFAAAQTAEQRAKAAGLTYFKPAAAGTTPNNTTAWRNRTSVAPIVKGIADWQKQNPNASNYWHAYAPGGNTEIGALMRSDPQGYLAAYQAYNPIGGDAQDLGLPPGYGPGGGGGYGGGGGGGAAGPQGLDQATLDYLASILGQGRPKDIAYEAIDLPDPGQYMSWDNALYGQARQGVAQGIEGIRGRGNTAFDQAAGELNRYQNPYEGGLQTRNPDLQMAMQRMMQANNVNPGQVGQTQYENINADRAMANQLAMLAATDQSRQAGNLRALEGDRRTMEQNLGLEGNMLNLGVNMAEAKGKSAFDQALQAARLNAANQEAQTNWQRRNQVGDTNVGAGNAWMQNALNAWLGLIGQKAPGVTLPANGTLPWAV